ncbi:MAG: helix-turn-helix transcriptional regulator [Clostridia bacterium]|nr:helix-turn-helix transcriptional regulator [Clostridia bacterium]
MQKHNICKFVSPTENASLLVSRFILETNPAVMETAAILGEHRVILVTAGEGTLAFGGSSCSAIPGDLVFGFSGEQFQAHPGPGFQYMYVDFHGIRGEELLRRFGIRPATRRFSGFEGLIPLWIESLARADERTIDLAAESMLLYALSRLSGQLAGETGPVRQVMELSEARFTDPNLSLSALAEDLGYNTKYLSHLFKAKTGTGYTDYLRNLRIGYAVSLFDHGIDSVKNVALLSGFADPLYFSAVFKKHTGLSPKDYKGKR